MATKKTGAAGKPAPLDAKVADKLLDLLGTDNEFRRLFKKDPGAALVKAGYKLPKGDAAAADNLQKLHKQLKVDKIAPKANVQKARMEIKSSLTSGLAMQPIQLNVASSTVRRKRS
jgi:putative modified peptide